MLLRVCMFSEMLFPLWFLIQFLKFVHCHPISVLVRTLQAIKQEIAEHQDPTETPRG